MLNKAIVNDRIIQVTTAGHHINSNSGLEKSVTNKVNSSKAKKTWILPTKDEVILAPLGICRKRRSDNRCWHP